MGFMFHTWWSCTRIRTYWNKIFHLIRKVTGVAVPQEPTIALLGGRVKQISKHTHLCEQCYLVTCRIWKDICDNQNKLLFNMLTKKGLFICVQLPFGLARPCDLGRMQFGGVMAPGLSEGCHHVHSLLPQDWCGVSLPGMQSLECPPGRIISNRLLGGPGSRNEQLLLIQRELLVDFSNSLILSLKILGLLTQNILEVSIFVTVLLYYGLCRLTFHNVYNFCHLSKLNNNIEI